MPFRSTNKQTHACHHIDVQWIHAVHFSVDTCSQFVKYLNFSNDLTRVSGVWGNSKATTASFSWGSSCAIDLSACHMRTRRRRKERGWTHFYTGETISWLYFSQDAKSIRNNKKMGSCKHLFSSSSSLLNQYDLCVNSCLHGVLGTAGTAAQLSVSLLPIVQSRKRKRCWWDKLQHQTRSFASKEIFSKQKGSKRNKME